MFGSNVPNVEQWRVGSTLRGHSGGKILRGHTMFETF